MSRLLNVIINNIKFGRYLHVAFDSGGRHKPTVVLIHGIAATSKTWDALIKELDTETYRVIALDILGFGESPKPTNCDYDVADHARYIHSTLWKLGVNRPYKIVGHSMGAIISAYYYSRYPNDVRGIFLLSPPIYLDNEDLTKNISRQRTDMYLNMYRYLSEKKDFTIKNSQFARKFLGIKDGIDVNEENWDSFRLSLTNTIIRQNTFDDIKNIKSQVHIIYGALDEFLIPEGIEKLSEFDQIKITKLMAVNHAVGVRFSKAVARQIRESDLASSNESSRKSLSQ